MATDSPVSTARIPISEIYSSLQGEGRWTGSPSVFVRVSGCNLRCGFCDTPFASWNPESTRHSISQILVAIEQASTTAGGVTATDVPRDVVLTGGEPMIFSSIVELCERVSLADYRITIETAGTAFLDLPCDLMSISPKLSNSTPASATVAQTAGPVSQKLVQQHEQRRFQPQVVRRLIDRYDYQIKFVVGSRNDIPEIGDLLAQVDAVDPAKVLLMPMGTTECELDDKIGWIRETCTEHGYTPCDRMHIRWYGNRRGT